jgi:hypothetical protein
VLKKNEFRRSLAGTREELRVAENRAVVIRKLLRRLKGRLPRGVTSDAEQLVRTIEALAHFGQTCSAAEAVEIEFQVGVLTSRLEIEVDDFFAL